MRPGRRWQPAGQPRSGCALGTAPATLGAGTREPAHRDRSRHPEIGSLNPRARSPSSPQPIPEAKLKREGRRGQEGPRFQAEGQRTRTPEQERYGKGWRLVPRRPRRPGLPRVLAQRPCTGPLHSTTRTSLCQDLVATGNTSRDLPLLDLRTVVFQPRLGNAHNYSRVTLDQAHTALMPR